MARPAFVRLLALNATLSRGVSASVNYTWSHCISDYYEAQVGTGAAVGLPGYKATDPPYPASGRGICSRGGH